MDEGLIQFLVVAFFIVISMMDGAARKRRKAAESLGSPPESNRLAGADLDLGEAAESEQVLPKDVGAGISAFAGGKEPTSLLEQPPTHAPDSTSGPAREQEQWTSPQEDIPEWRDPGTERGAGSPRTQRPSQDLIVSPSQDMTVRPSEEWDSVVQAMTRSGDLQGGYLHPDQAASHEEHAHEKHAVVDSPASPLPAERPHEFVPHSRELPSKPQKVETPGALLSRLRRGDRKSLREAIVLAEVLSPPVVLRDSGWKPLF